MASNIASKKRSLIWKFFRINSDDERYVNCKICSSKLSRGGSDPRSYGTSALTCHLRTKHTAQYVEYQKETALAEVEAAHKRSSVRDSSSEPLSKQPTFSAFVDGKKPFHANNPKQVKITRLIGEMMAIDVQPFSMVTDTGFTQLMHFLEPRYRMPDRTSFSRTVIPDLYKEVANNLLTEVRLGLGRASDSICFDVLHVNIVLHLHLLLLLNVV